MRNSPTPNGDAPDTEQIVQALNTVAQIPSKVEGIVAKALHPVSAAVYDARSFMLAPGDIFNILPYHAGRIKFNVRASVADAIVIGNINDLQNNSGWNVQVNDGVDLHTVAAVWAKNVSDAVATISLWVEYVEA